MPTDQELIALVIRGKAEHFGELVARYQKPVFLLACGMLANRTDAEDAAQEVFIRAFKSLVTYAETGRFWWWLRRITVNVCLSKFASVKMTSLDEAEEVPNSQGDEVYESVLCAVQAEHLRSKIQQLPTPYRSVIVLRYLEDMSYAEIAETLGETISNVQVRLHRAKKMLRKEMKVCVI